jgi:hypothetical protein
MGDHALPSLANSFSNKLASVSAANPPVLPITEVLLPNVVVTVSLPARAE